VVTTSAPIVIGFPQLHSDIKGSKLSRECRLVLWPKQLYFKRN